MKIEEKEGHLIITNFNELEAYEIACRIEKDGRSFYEELLKKTLNQPLKETLEFLIKDEENHLKFFEAQIVRLRTQQDKDQEENDLLNSLDYGVFSLYQSAEQIEAIINNPRKVLSLGLAVEKKSIDFYEKCKEKVFSLNTKVELQRIIDEEKKHRALFEKMLATLQ